ARWWTEGSPALTVCSIFSSLCRPSGLFSFVMTQTIILEPALQWSGAVRRKVDAQPEFGSWLERAVQRPISPERIEHWFVELGGTPNTPMPAETLRPALRRLRQRVFHGLAVRDIAGSASLLEVVDAMTHLAELAVAQAYCCVAHNLAEIHGAPVDPETGAPQEMIIIGMGKLGGRE